MFQKSKNLLIDLEYIYIFILSQMCGKKFDFNVSLMTYTIDSICFIYIYIVETLQTHSHSRHDLECLMVGTVFICSCGFPSYQNSSVI